MMSSCEPFATVEQYEERYGDYPNDDVLSAVLMDATRLIEAELQHASIELLDETADMRMQVCRQAAHRVLSQGNDLAAPVGMTQMSSTAGPFTRSVSFGSGYGDLYLTKQEKRMLGIGSGVRVGFIVPGLTGGDSDA